MTRKTQLDSVEAFSSWSRARMAQKKGGLSAKSVAVYRSIWDSWCEWLAGRDRRWHGARSEDVRAFLETITPARRGGAEASPVTQARYARVLRAVYSNAVVHGALARNPVDRPAQPSHTEEHDSRVFDRGEWKLLVDGVAVDAARWQSVRDASVLLTFMHAALTVSEIRALDLGDVRHPLLTWEQDRAHLAPSLFASIDQEAPAFLNIPAKGKKEERSVPLRGRALAALLAWLEVRLCMPGTARTHALYVSRKRAAGAAPTSPGGRLSLKSLFVLARDHARLALAARHGPATPGHCGPMQLRSSCIVRWLEAGQSEDEVIKLAGLKDLNSLRRLRGHVHPNPKRKSRQGAPA